MPLFNDTTPETIKSSILSRMETDLQTREGSYANDMVSPISFELWRWAMTLDQLLDAFYINEGSGIYIDQQASALAVYRKEGARAQCGITFQGKDGTTVPAGTLFYSEDGLTFALDADVTIQDGAGSGLLVAAESGSAYNIEAGEIVRTQRNYAGVTSYENAQAAGGTDQESDSSLCGRYYERLRRPGTSGNGWHYQQWAAAVEGVGAARVIGKWDGPGTVKVILADSNYQPAAPQIVAAAAEAIRAERPVGAEATVEAAGALTIDVEAQTALDSTTTPGAVQEALREALDAYLGQLTRESFGEVLDAEYDDQTQDVCAVSYNRVAYLLLSISGVVDFTALSVNGARENAAVPAGCIPILGEVTVT